MMEWPHGGIMTAVIYSPLRNCSASANLSTGGFSGPSPLQFPRFDQSLSTVRFWQDCTAEYILYIYTIVFVLYFC